MKLDGVKVIDLSMFLPGPHFTMMMADHGADVIRVEPLSGEPSRELGWKQDGESIWFRNTHRGKRSLRLNLKDPRGKALLLKLVGGADVFVEGFRPGVMARLGLDYESLKPHAPQLIYCSLSAFGQTGRYRDKPAHNVAMEALLGTVSFNLGQDGKPALPGIPAADMCGSLTAFAGVLMALLRQRTTGQGDYLDIAMHDALLAWTANYQGPIFAARQAHQVKLERNWGGAAFYNAYATRDGQWLVMGGSEIHFCANVLNKAGRPELIDLCREPPGLAQQPVADFLREFFAARTLEEALAWLADVDCCYAPVRTLLEGMLDPNTRERGMLLSDGNGRDHLGIPIRYSEEPGEVDFRVPALGEHSVAVAREAGLDEALIAEMIRDGVI